jgi:transcriptional regulator with GAF, ATPase, and Fis domain
LIARALHRAGARRHRPFVAINCSALPESLLESELFGHEKGSFTGAQTQRRGRFELADGGTLFLDEITETSAALQARLLRVLQDGRFERVGGEQTLKAEVRVIAACNRDLHAEVEAGRFRADLFYRLNGFLITLPPLRARREEIPLLVRHFLRKYDYHKTEDFSDAATTALQNYGWPGNVRELENAVRRAAVLARSEGRTLIQTGDLPKEILSPPAAIVAPASYRTLPEQILEMLRAMKFSRNAITATAKALGNRDRGTITEYFRGMCFEYAVQAKFDWAEAARRLAGTTEEEVVQRVRAKIEEYRDNLQASLAASNDLKDLQARLDACCKGLPKKYHIFVKSLAEHFAAKIK